MKRCENCRHGFFAGITIPTDLDDHPTELYRDFRHEAEETLATLEKLLELREKGSWEQEKQATEVLAKHSLDLIPLILNLHRRLNIEYGLYHEDALKKVNRSVQTLAERRKQKDRLRAAR